ncbi:unnamed protein product, partial [Urochloa humidicola]
PFASASASFLPQPQPPPLDPAAPPRPSPAEPSPRPPSPADVAAARGEGGRASGELRKQPWTKRTGPSPALRLYFLSPPVDPNCPYLRAARPVPPPPCLHPEGPDLHADGSQAHR